MVAYLDGGSGSMLLQAGLAGLLGLSYFVKQKWRALLHRFKGSNSSPEPPKEIKP